MSTRPSFRDSAAFHFGPWADTADIEQDAARRLALAAVVLGGLILANLFLYTAVPFLGGPEMGDPAGWVDVTLFVLALLCFLFAWIIRRLAHRPALALNLGLAFEVALGWSIAFILRALTHRLWIPVDGISDLCVLILVFPMLVPAPPWKTLLASLLVATADPVSVVVTAHSLQQSVSGPVLLEAFHFNYLCAVLAVMPSMVLLKLRRQVHEARRMGAYQLEEKLGSGGMGEVWAARHALLARPAAVKVIRSETLLTTPERAAAMLLRFEREARATARLESPHSIQLFDYGRSEDGVFYYVMEFLDGLDLETVVKRYGPLDPSRVAYLMQQACHSLADAHGRGLIHRDIKPANLFLCRLGRDYDFLKVLDFGLVRGSMGEHGSDIRATGENELPGTPATMAPEIVRGSPPVDHRSDLYSLGCVAYWLLTGELVFDGDTPMQVIIQHLEQEPMAPSQRSELGIPEDLDTVVLACLAKDPAERPADAEELAQRLLSCACSSGWGNQEARRWWQNHRPTGEFRKWIESSDDLQ